MDDETKMMKCGGAGNAMTWKDGKPIPCCSRHHWHTEDAITIDDNPPSLENRMASCTDCHILTSSNLHLAFFHYMVGQEFDEYYCGCQGWD